MDQKTEKLLEQLNAFTRRTHTLDEVYLFDLILCDNEIDRDGDCFSDAALAELQKRFVGVTGIFDHNPKSANQTARIFRTELRTEPGRLTKAGKPYRCLVANAYMVRTEGNADLIREIDAGIKKEVSISCAAAKRICSVCGSDKAVTSCNHVKGRKYGGKLCHTILDDITDTYEWSFVAVPAQVNAGVTKKYTESDTVKAQGEDISAADDELRRDIRRLAYFAGGRSAADIASLSAASLTTKQLIALRRSFEEQCGRGRAEVQLAPANKEADPTEGFSMR